ncbi:MAG TPA: cupredoxin domain-containing protein [Allosphingosinicella sp.]|jgi:plastocyanin
MRFVPTLLALLVLPATTLSAQDQAAPRTVEVQLSSFDFTPSTINLRAGQPVTLHLANTGNGGHNFSAPEFFAASSGVSGPVARGAVEVSGHQSVDVSLTPARGTYRLKCTHTLHTSFGMRGAIVVE